MPASYTDPLVMVSVGDLGDVSTGVPATSAATASVDHLPGGYQAADLTAHWSYSTVYISYSETGADETWDTATDSTTAGVTLSGADSDPTGVFSGTFMTEGYYEVCLAADVTYHVNATGQDLGPYSGFDFVSNAQEQTAQDFTPSIIRGHHKFLPFGAPPPPHHPTVKVSSTVIPTIVIDGQNNPLDPGGLVVPNRDNNGALRQRIIVDAPNASQSWKSDPNNAVVITRSNTKVDIYRQASDGLPMVYSGPQISSVFPASSLPVTLYVAGTTPSQTMKDVQVTAQATTHGKAGQTGTANFTVLWVDDINVRASTGQTLSDDNSAKNILIADFGTKQLGGVTYSSNAHYIGWFYEAQAAVHPSAFDYPLNNLHLDRDIQCRFYINNNQLDTSHDADGVGNKDFSSVIPIGNDTSLSEFRDDNPIPAGNIYDADFPGYSTSPAWNDSEIRRVRFNGRELACVLVQGKQTRCSRITGFYLRASMQQIRRSDDVLIWIGVNDVQNDNQSGPGTTPLTYDLK